MQHTISRPSFQFPRWHLILALGWWTAVVAPQTAWAQTYAPVLSSTPIYDVQLSPHTQCTPAAVDGATRCTTHMVREEQLLGYEVRYSYEGQQFVQRMPHDPGARIAINLRGPNHAYSTAPAGAQNWAHPGQKSYGSAPAAGALPDAIEYRNPAQIPPIYVEVQVHNPLSPPPAVLRPARPQPANR